MILIANSLSVLQKIKVLNRSLEAHLPSSSGSAAPISRNLDPALHPFARPREYARAVVASKLERMFSKPFVASLEGHGDGLYCMTKDESGGLGRIASGSGDGEFRVWDLGNRESIFDVVGAHKGMVQGIAFSHPAAGEEGRVEKKIASGEKSFKRKRGGADDKGKGREEDAEEEEEQDREASLARGSSRVLTCGVDKTVKLWDIRGARGVGVKVSHCSLLPPCRHWFDKLMLLLIHSLCKPTMVKRDSIRYHIIDMIRFLLPLRLRLRFGTRPRPLLSRLSNFTRLHRCRLVSISSASHLTRVRRVCSRVVEVTGPFAYTT